MKEARVPGTSSETVFDNLLAEAPNFLKAFMVGIETMAMEKIAPTAVERTKRIERSPNSGDGWSRNPRVLTG